MSRVLSIMSLIHSTYRKLKSGKTKKHSNNQFIPTSKLYDLKLPMPLSGDTAKNTQTTRTIRPERSNKVIKVNNKSTIEPKD